MIESMPGDEPIIMESVPRLIYCGGCMVEMTMQGKHLACPLCHLHY
ncbi:MAG TPA: hypothetical protein VFF28_00375 [Candidatus Nanoarchaeia archaeon]|nr:hypothetical protein [Candidatus Nanoarchaeia archaeon]